MGGCRERQSAQTTVEFPCLSFSPQMQQQAGDTITLLPAFSFSSSWEVPECSVPPLQETKESRL